jgi:hypothetical protein
VGSSKVDTYLLYHRSIRTKETTVLSSNEGCGWGLLVSKQMKYFFGPLSSFHLK